MAASNIASQSDEFSKLQRRVPKAKAIGEVSCTGPAAVRDPRAAFSPCTGVTKARNNAPIPKLETATGKRNQRHLRRQRR